MRAAFRERWMPHLESDAAPLSPYRIVWELMQVADRTRTVVTHDAGPSARPDRAVLRDARAARLPGLGQVDPARHRASGLAMGARLAKPDWLSVNIMGDAAFGMVGMDFETAVRARIPILTIVMNNGLMGGYGEWMPDAVARVRSQPPERRLRRRRPALGGHAERVERPDELRPRSSAASPATPAGQAALLEVMTHEEHELALG